MLRLIASTCGISVLRNGASREDQALLNRCANRKAPLPSDDWPTALAQLAMQAAATMNGAPASVAACASAELNGIITYYGERWPREARQDTHVLLHTDTHLGATAAEIVKDYLERAGVHATLQRLVGLTTASSAAFEAGMQEAVLWCQEADRDQRRHGVRVVYNLSGGFKSWLGYMSALGMLYADELVYIFEDSKALIRIPRLPLAIDDAAVAKDFDVLRRMRIAPVPADDAAAVRESLVTVHEGMASLSFLGAVLVEARCDRVYPSRLLESPHPLLRFGSRLGSAVGQWQGQRQMEDINRRVDDLAQYLASGGHNNVRRLDLKPLQGNPCPPSTHEFDLWSDGAAWRGFGHYADQVFIIDRMGPPLHH